MLEVKLMHASLLKKVIESMKDLVNEANFDCSSTGFSLQAMDPTREAMVLLLLRSEAFDHYRCDRNLTMGLNLHNMARMLRCADDVTIIAADVADCVTFTFDSLETDFEMKLMDIDMDDLDKPETVYDAIVQMPSSEFARICRDLCTIGDYVVISVTKEGLKFSTKGDTGTTSILYEQYTSVDKREEETIIEMERPVSLTCSLRFLKLFTKATTLASQVTLCFSTELPIVVEYIIQGMGYMRFHLAPKIEEDKTNRKNKRLRKNMDFSYFKKEDMEDRKRHRAKIEIIKEEKLRLKEEMLRLKKEEQENKVIFLKEEVCMMRQKQMDTDMQFFLTQHVNLAGAALKAVIARKRDIAQSWGWE